MIEYVQRVGDITGQRCWACTVSTRTIPVAVIAEVETTSAVLRETGTRIPYTATEASCWSKDQRGIDQEMCIYNKRLRIIRLRFRSVREKPEWDSHQNPPELF